MPAFTATRNQVMIEAVALRFARYVPALVAIGLLAGSLVARATADSGVHSRPGTTTSIILTRHAERTEVTKVLTEKGHQRARDLVGAVAGLEVAAIYSPDLERNLDTVRPLAKYLGIEISVQPANSTPLVNDIVADMLQRHAGKTVLWVGNVSNLRAMYWRLGGDGEGPIGYGDLFIVTVPDSGPTSIEKRHYGAS
jgi:hypothetical protein